MSYLKKCLFLLLLLLTSHRVTAENADSPLYTGGMLALQPGYTFASNSHQSVQGLSSSIGGMLRFYFLEHLTIGVTGGAQKTSYTTTGSDQSYLNLGYGGPFVGYTSTFGRFRWCASLFGGMGSIHNLHVESQTGEVLDEAYLHTYPAVLFGPILSMDFALTSKIGLTAQAIGLMGTYDHTRRIYNPTLQFGFVFSR